MSCRKNISYLVPRDPSIKCWEDRVKLSSPCGKNLIQLNADEFEETMGDTIKVYLRLKASNSAGSPYTIVNPTTLQTEAPKDSVAYKNVSNGVGKLVHKFTFTSILDENTTQKEFFKKCAVNSLKKFICGQNFLLMAYGTTSAGKTYTMQGTVLHPGVIPRALDFVFSALKDNIIPTCSYSPHQCNEIIELNEEQLRKNSMYKNFFLSLDLSKYQRYPEVTQVTFETNPSSYSDSYENVTFKEMQSNLVEKEPFEIETGDYKYWIWISMIEIYNEQVYDLLEFPNEKGAKPNLIFRSDGDGKLFVKNLRYVHVSSAHEAFQIFQFGKNNLHLAPTALNNRSSRSHCVFTITLAKFLDSDVSSCVISRFSFCDLAGMERAKKTLIVKDRLVESKAINTSLSILVKCLTTFKENQNSKEKKMIPFRESKLTTLFRDAVLGKEQFSLIINVTTEPNLFDETLSVLKFSSIAQKIVPQNGFRKPKLPVAVKRSRFSRIVVNAAHSNATIIDWDKSTAADEEAKRTSSEDSDTQLRDLVRILRGELDQEKKRCEEIEVKIREELTGNFSEILKKLTESHRIRMQEERERLQERYEEREERLAHYYEMLSKNKRPKLDEDVSFMEENKLKELEESVRLLQAENETLKEHSRELLVENKKLVSESSELKFKMADKDRMLEDTKKAYEAKKAGVDDHEKELREQLDKANLKIIDFKRLLDEAASDYKELEECNKFLTNENEILQLQLTEEKEAVIDLKNETAELQNLLCQKRIMIEKLESANEVMKKEKEEREIEKKREEISMKEVEILREQLKKTSERLGQCREECRELREEKVSLEEDLKIGKLKVGDLEERNRELEEEVKTLQKEMKELVSVSGKESEGPFETKESHDEEFLSLKMRNEELQEELKRQQEKLNAVQRESEAELENLRVKLESEVFQLQGEIEKYEKELENRESDMVSFNENREVIFSNLEKELAKLREENERLQQNALLSKTIGEEKLEMQKSNKKKTEGIYEERHEREAAMEEEDLDLFRKPELGESQSERREVSPEEEKQSEVENTPERLARQMRELSVQRTGQKSTRKKVDLLDETIHPSAIKSNSKGRKKKENGRKEKEKDAVVQTMENEKENLPSKKKNKCYKKLFVENDFGTAVDLRASPLEGISRLRPRK